MVFLDLFPAGIYQFKTVTEQGLWYARSSSFIESTGFQTLTWLRIAGGSLFTLGGVIPLVWFITRGRKGLKKMGSGILKQSPDEKNTAPLAEY